jgi:AcrR family transcriptional regulator
MARAAAQANKEPLSRERIELAALDLIEADGLDGFSIRKLATMVGCEPMSIYHWFPSKGHLMDALIDHVIAEIPPLPEKSLPWIEQVRRMGRNMRAAFTGRPKLFAFVGTHRMNTPKALAFLETTIRLFEQSGMPREQAVRTFRAVSYYIMGTALDETAGYARGPSTVDPVPDEVMKRDYPGVTAAGKYFAPDQFDATFELGWEAMLDGIAKLRSKYV